MRFGLAAALATAISVPGSCHRLDEYLQNTIVSVENHRLRIEMVLTPGAAVFPFLAAQMDTDRDGYISDAEQRAYSSQILRDTNFSIDGEKLTPWIAAPRFPSIEDMKQGRGEIHLDVESKLPARGGNRHLTIESRHQSRISAYQVNCLVPRDTKIRILAQHRNYTQSHYELEFEATDVREEPSLLRFLSGPCVWSSPIALIFLVRLTLLGRKWQRGERPLSG